MRSLLRIVSAIGVAVSLAAGAPVVGQVQVPRKRLLVIGEEKGYRHEAVTHAMVTIERLGTETGLWDTVIRTDTEALTKKKLEYNAKNLNDFDAVVFYTGGTLEMDDQQKADFLVVRPRRRQGVHRHPQRDDHLHRSGPSTAR